MIALCLGHTERDSVVIRHRLDDAIEVIGIQTHVQLRSRMVVLVVLKLVGIEAHMGENGARVVHRDHANTVLVEDQAHLYEHGLKSFGESSDGSGLHGFCHDEFLGHSAFVYLPGGSSKFFSAMHLQGAPRRASRQASVLR